jgi:two-component system, LytTR family, sensor kinase
VIDKIYAFGLAGSRWKTWLTSFAVWTLIGAISTSRHYLGELYRGNRVEGWRISGDDVTCYFIWAALTPPILALAHRFPLAGARRSLHLSLHALISMLAAILASVAGSVISAALSGSFSGPALIEGFQRVSRIGFILEIVTYWAIICVGHGLDYYGREQKRELRASHLELKASQLEMSLRQAQLDALRMQLHPHFLFNTLNTISVLMREDVETANRLLILLSELLRAAVKNGQREVPLREELDFLARYLEIEQTRFRGRLSTRFDVAPAMLDALVPSLILQPLVENAIKHGVTRCAKPGLIEIIAQRADDFIELQVRDNGPGLIPAEAPGKDRGVGLANTRARLEQLYHTTCRFEFQNIETGGLLVTVAFPFRTAHVEGTIQPQSSHR